MKLHGEWALVGDLVVHDSSNEEGLVINTSPMMPSNEWKKTLKVWFPRKGKSIWCLAESITILSTGKQ